MNRRQLLMLPGMELLRRRAFAQGHQPKAGGAASASETEQVLPDRLLLMDYRPKSVYKIPVTDIIKAKSPIVDVHYHARAKTPEDIDALVKIMDRVSVERLHPLLG